MQTLSCSGSWKTDWPPMTYLRPASDKAWWSVTVLPSSAWTGNLYDSVLWCRRIIHGLLKCWNRCKSCTIRSGISESLVLCLLCLTDISVRHFFTCIFFCKDHSILVQKSEPAVSLHQKFRKRVPDLRITLPLFHEKSVKIRKQLDPPTFYHIEPGLCTLISDPRLI